MSNNGAITIERIYELLPKAVLLPIAEREKKPHPALKAWQTITFDETQNDAYQEVLRLLPNTGVLLGTPSGNLCTVDADGDQYLTEFLELNPALGSFVSKGHRGGQVWMYLIGEYPHRVQKLKTKNGEDWGEFRSDGGQSVVRGIHRNGNHYEWLASNPPAEIQFSDIKWPDTLILPWQEQAKGKAVEEESGPVIATQRIDACELKEELLQVLPEYAEMLVPGGRRVGDRWVAGSIDGGEGKSFSINLLNGACGDFAEDARMYDPIGLWMRVHDVDFPTALGGVRTWLDTRDWSDSPRNRPKPKNKGHNQKAKQAIAPSDSEPSPKSKLSAEESIRNIINPADKRSISIPGDNRLISEFGIELGQTLHGYNFFNFRGKVATLEYDPEINTTRLVVLDPQRFRSEIEKYIQPIRTIERGNGRQIFEITALKTISIDVARATVTAPQFLSQLREISQLNTVRLPVMRPDGEVELPPVGYDERSKTYTIEQCAYDTTWTQERGVKFLRDLLSEFCFREDDLERSVSVVLAQMLTLYASDLLRPNTVRPGFLFSANSSGSGKTLLAKLAVLPRLGYMPVGVVAESDDEMRKRISSAVASGAPVLFLDNIKTDLDCAPLEAAMTSPVWSDRLLGTNAEITAPVRFTVIATGNGCTYSSDMRRRLLTVELFMKEVKAEDRQIRRPLDDAVILRLRPQILSALWSLVRSWFEYGAPSAKQKHNSFIPWSLTIGGILEHAGFSSPCEIKQLPSSGDRQTQEMETLVNLMKINYPYNFSELKDLIIKHELFSRVMATDNDREIASTLGRLFSRFNNRCFTGGRFFLIEGGVNRKTYSTLNEQR